MGDRRQWAGHPQPVFAPIATVVGLNAQPGERGTNAVRLLLGVAVGVLAAEGCQRVWDPSEHLFAALSTAVFVSLTAALALTSERIVMAQAAASAVIAVLTGDPHATDHRLIDALIGVGVALVFSQLLLPAQPLSTLRRAERRALRHLSETMGDVADALERNDAPLAEHAAERMEDAVAHLADITHVRGRSTRSAQRSPLRRGRLTAVRQEAEHAHRLQLLSLSCLSLMRAVLDPAQGDRSMTVLLTQRFQEVLGTLAFLDGDAGRQAAGQMLDLVRTVAEGTRDDQRFRDTVGAILRQTAIDVLVFAGDGETAAAKAVDAAWRAPNADPLDPRRLAPGRSADDPDA
ncbi:aromatic acid exporter family protein [Spirillospora sp. NPDC050679]